MAAARQSLRYRFSQFELQRDERRLLDGGLPVAIAPRTFDLLAALVERAGHLVTKDELFERVWPKVIVEEAALQVQISSLRKMLGRDAITTVTGRGYRFALEASQVDVEDRSAKPAPGHNLPIPLSTFVGREQQVAELAELLRRTRLLTLVGSGGCGKTRLATHTAAQLLHEYPEGIWLVEYAALADPQLVPDAVARVLGLKEQADRSLVQVIADHLAQKHLLLVLDNAEHVLDACAQLSHALLSVCPALRLLVTSRERLGIVGELTYRVPSLSVPDLEHRATPEQLTQYESARLFVDRAQLQRPQFVVTPENAATLASICCRLDGIPLAIELAAARVRSMGLEEVSRRLDQRFDLLTGGSRTALPRHQTLRSLIDWDYDLLSGAEQALLCRASIFSGGWTLEAAAQVCVGDRVHGKDLLQLLTSLADKSLVLAKEHRDSSRYGLLESVRYYASDRLSESGEATTLARRHFEHLLSLAEAADAKQLSDEQGVWLERLEAEHDNLRAALAWSCTAGGNAAGGLRLAAALGWFWRSRGHLGEGRRWLSVLIDAAPDGQDSPTLAGALRWASVLALDQADYTAAEALQKEALAIYRRVGDRMGIARVLNNLAIVAMEQANHSTARLLFEESMVILRELGDQQGVSRGLSNMGVVAQLLGDHAAAQALYEEALAIQRTLGDRGMIANLTHNLGSALCFQGDYPRGRTLLKESLSIRTELANRFGLVDSLETFACVASLQAQPARAARLWGRALRLREEIGSAQSPSALATLDPYVAAARSAIGDGAFESAWADGRAMALDQVTRELLES